MSVQQETNPSSALLKARPGATWLAWSLCGLSLVLLALALLLVLLGWSRPLPADSFPQWEGHLTNVIGAIGAPILGGLIAARRPDNAYGWLWLGFGLSLALLLSAQSYGTYAAAHPGTLPVLGVVLVIGGVAWLVAYASLPPFLLLLFPDGRLPSQRWRPMVWIILAMTFVGVVGGPFQPGESGVASIENPFGVEGALGVALESLLVIVVLVLFGCTLLSAGSLFFRYRRADGVQRQQIKWFTYAAVVFGGLIIFGGFLGRDLPGIWDAVFETVTLSGLYVAVGLAILKHRLLDIDLVINRTVVYGVLTICVVGIYVLVVGYLGAVFQARGSLAISLAATGIVAVLFAPLRNRLQHGVNRLMYGERDDPYAVISRLGERLEETLAPEAVLPVVVETVREALKLPYAAIMLKSTTGSEKVAASAGEPVEKPQRLPLTYQNEPVGELLLAPRTGEGDFSVADRQLLEDLARQAGVAAHAVRLTADLQRARERLVVTREEERRRLRRDLHDGLGPMLGSLTLKLDVARDLVEQDPTTVRELLGGLKEQAQGAVTDIRRLVYALRPPALDDLGLVGAIRETAAQYDTRELDISVEAPEGLSDLPAAVEVAAYRIVQEAVTNVARHAAASRCVIRLALDEEAGALVVEIEDDGRGLSAGRGRGVGIVSMRERAEELGGSCVVESLPAGGTCVRTSLPCADSTRVGEEPSPEPDEGS